ncbi:MAG: CoA transferase, partial [Saprospiraceae bacterium]|nr:CoA transferase [Saprospiraceae bacterium]
MEIASALAGPQAGTFFSELGADITKVENRKYGGDISRQWRIQGEAITTPDSIYYCSINGHKQNIFLDLSQIEDHAQVMELVRSSDIVLTNFTATKAKEFKVEYTDLINVNPQIILANVTGFG